MHGSSRFPRDCREKGESGGVVVRVVMATVTLAIIGTLIAVSLRSAGQREEADQRKAVRISEYGLQEALDSVQKDPSWASGNGKTPCDGGWYAIALRRFSRNDTPMLDVQSTGTMGTVTDVKECLLMRVSVNGDSLWAPQGIH